MAGFSAERNSDWLFYGIDLLSGEGYHSDEGYQPEGFLSDQQGGRRDLDGSERKQDDHPLYSGGQRLLCNLSDV